MTNQVMAALASALEASEPVVLATVVKTNRSVPRRPGSKMLVRVDGTSFGSVGGGEMEARVLREAAAALIDGEPRLLNYQLVDPSTGDPGVCGGEATIYLEPHMPDPKLLIVGAGHVGQAVAELADWLDFDTLVWDDRDEILDDLPALDAAVATYGSIGDVLAANPLTHRDAVVIVTRNVSVDLEVLPALLRTTAGFVGLMGSTRRWQTTRTALAESGVSTEDLDRVKTPIGVEINAETPAEIAVSVLAAVIAQRRSPQAQL